MLSIMHSKIFNIFELSQISNILNILQSILADLKRDVFSDFWGNIYFTPIVLGNLANQWNLNWTLECDGE